MKPILIDAEQRSPEWFQSRLGRLTGSRASDMLAKIKTGEAAARRDYRLELVCERLTQQSQQNGFVNEAMQRGIDLEPAALAAYESLTGNLARRTGFLQHPTLMAGCSLDGDVDDFTGILELKCPKTTTHYGYLKAGILPAAYVAQVTHNLWITGAEWCDFLSFDDRFPVPTFLVRVYAKDFSLMTYEEEAKRFLAEVDAEAEDVLKRTHAHA